MSHIGWTQPQIDIMDDQKSMHIEICRHMLLNCQILLFNIFIFCKLRGNRAVVKVIFRRGCKYSLLLCGDLNGVVCFDIIKGACNESRFLRFVVEEIIDHLNPYPQPRSILLLDNCQFHHSAIFKSMIRRIGAIILFIPPYSPWLNLCEYQFNAIKVKEKGKQIVGEVESFLSLCDSVGDIGNNWLPILRKIGYCNN